LQEKNASRRSDRLADTTPILPLAVLPRALRRCHDVRHRRARRSPPLDSRRARGVGLEPSSARVAGAGAAGAGPDVTGAGASATPRAPDRRAPVTGGRRRRRPAEVSAACRRRTRSRSGHFSLAFVGRASKVTKEFLSALVAAW
jgi:hypothetical protein